jgi:hypothetical protein
MDILTLELFDVTVSEALREIGRAVAERPALPLRILVGSDLNLQHNIQRLLERLGRPAVPLPEGPVWRLDVPAGTPPPAAPVPAGAAALPAPAPAPPPAGPAPPPLLLTRSGLGPEGQDSGRRHLLGLLRELDPAVPWVGLALGGLDLLDDPQAVAVLEQLQARGTPVRVSREGHMFSQMLIQKPNPFEVMEDSHWQRLAGRGALTLI